jgi:WD40 repeat protein
MTKEATATTGATAIQAIGTASTIMATSHSNKRHKMTCPNDAVENIPMNNMIDSILNVDRQVFKDHARTLDWGAFALLLNRLSELKRDMEATLASFSDVPPLVIASNVFPFLENRNDWNNFSLVNKDINHAVTNHKQLSPPWPECQLTNESIEDSFVTSPTFSPDGKFIAHGDEKGNIYVWSRTKGLVANWQGHGDDDDADDEQGLSVDEVIFSPDSNILVTVGDSWNIKIWDLANDNRCLREWMQDDVSSIAFSPDGKLIATAERDGEPVYLRNVSDGTTSCLIRHALKAVYAVTYSPDGKTLALGGMGGMALGGSGSVELWKLDGAEDSSYSFEGHSFCVDHLAYSPDGALLAFASDDDTIKLWDVAKRQCVRTLVGHNDDVYSISFSPDGNFLASADSHFTFELWSLADGNCIEAIKTSKHVYEVKAEFSPDSRMLLTNEVGSLLTNEGGSEIRLRSMDTYRLHELQEERADLMKLNTQDLQEELTNYNILFDLESTKDTLVNHLVRDLDKIQRKEILMRKKTDSQ